MSEKNEEIKNSESWVLLDLLKTHWKVKFTEAILLTWELMEKDLQELEYLFKNSESENIKKIIKIVMEFKINNL